MSHHLLTGGTARVRSSNPAGAFALLIVMAAVLAATYFVLQTSPREEATAREPAAVTIPAAIPAPVAPAGTNDEFTDDLAIHIANAKEALAEVEAEARKALDLVRAAAPGMRRLGLDTQVRRLEQADTHLWRVLRSSEQAFAELGVAASQLRR